MIVIDSPRVGRRVVWIRFTTGGAVSGENVIDLKGALHSFDSLRLY